MGNSLTQYSKSQWCSSIYFKAAEANVLMDRLPKLQKGEMAELHSHFYLIQGSCGNCISFFFCEINLERKPSPMDLRHAHFVHGCLSFLPREETN